MATRKSTVPGKQKEPAGSSALIDDIRSLIAGARQHVVTTANATLTLLYWRIGARIRTEVLGGDRARYGEQIVVSLIRELSWSHFLALLPLKEPLQREFYAEMCRSQRWSVRTLRSKVAGMLYERTALSRRPFARAS